MQIATIRYIDLSRALSIHHFEVSWSPWVVNLGCITPASCCLLTLSWYFHSRDVHVGETFSKVLRRSHLLNRGGWALVTVGRSLTSVFDIAPIYCYPMISQQAIVVELTPAQLVACRRRVSREMGTHPPRVGWRTRRRIMRTDGGGLLFLEGKGWENK